MWNRVAAGNNIKEIKYLIVTQIMNAGTRDLIRAAHGTLSPPQSETKVWPGSDFSMDTAGGQALLGILFYFEHFNGADYYFRLTCGKVGWLLPYAA